MTDQEFAEKQVSGIDGWYIAEIFGHQRYAGYLTVQQLGVAAMLRIDVPALETRVRVMKRPTYIGEVYCPAGSEVEEAAVQGYTKIFGVGAIYALTPCTKDACIAAVEELQPRSMKPIHIAPVAVASIPAPRSDDDTDDDEVDF